MALWIFTLIPETAMRLLAISAWAANKPPSRSGSGATPDRPKKDDPNQDNPCTRGSHVMGGIIKYGVHETPLEVIQAEALVTMGQVNGVRCSLKTAGMRKSGYKLSPSFLNTNALRPSPTNTHALAGLFIPRMWELRSPSDLPTRPTSKTYCQDQPVRFLTFLKVGISHVRYLVHQQLRKV